MWEKAGLSISRQLRGQTTAVAVWCLWLILITGFIRKCQIRFWFKNTKCYLLSFVPLHYTLAAMLKLNLIHKFSLSNKSSGFIKKYIANIFWAYTLPQTYCKCCIFANPVVLSWLLEPFPLKIMCSLIQKLPAEHCLGASHWPRLEKNTVLQ